MTPRDTSVDEQKTASIIVTTEESGLPTKNRRSYGAALIATAAFLPEVAALITIMIFLAPFWPFCEDYSAPLWGSVFALLAWLLLALFCQRFTDVRYANPSIYGELRLRLAQLKSQLNVVCPGNAFLDEPLKKSACEQVRKQIQLIEKEMRKGGVSWASARGYINVWNRLHRAEEAMIEVEPQETVIAGALNDVLRLQGSKIDHCEDLTFRIRQAIDVIDASAMKYLHADTATPLPLTIVTHSPLNDGYETELYLQTLIASGGTSPRHWSLSQGSTLPEELKLSADGVLSGTPKEPTNGAKSFTVRLTDNANVSVTKLFSLNIKAGKDHGRSSVVVDAVDASANTLESNSIQQARAVLSGVRNAINEFRDGLWNGLIVARNRLIATMMFTGMTAFLLLAIAIIMGATKDAIAAASVYFLVGATIGLLNQLRSASQNDSALEDYGLSTARLITMPLFCGLAAISGVVLMAMPAGSYSTNTATLVITTPSNLESVALEQVYHQRIEATGGTFPYIWNVSNGSLPEGMKLKTTGDLIAKLPKETESIKLVKFTAQVTDRAGLTVEKSFFLDVVEMKNKEASEKQSYDAPAPTNARLLDNIFDLHKNVINLILAAVFGLTPGLLFDRLQQQSEKHKSHLKGSQAATTTKPPN